MVMTGRWSARRALYLLAATAFAVTCAGSAAAATLGAARMIAVGSAPDAVAIGDVTGDGRNDVVLTTGYANDPAHDFRVVVLAQLADGTLAAPTWYSTAGTYGNRPESVAVGDVTGDGKADVVVGLSGHGVQVLAQNGGGCRRRRSSLRTTATRSASGSSTRTPISTSPALVGVRTRSPFS